MLVRLLAAEIPPRAGDGSASTWGSRMHDTQSTVEPVAYQKHKDTKGLSTDNEQGELQSHVRVVPS